MIPCSFNRMGINPWKEEEEVKYVTKTISFQVRTVDEEFVSIHPVACIINGSEADLSYDEATYTYSTEITYSEDSPVVYLKLTNDDYLPYSNTFSDASAIPSQITMLKTSGSVVSWTATVSGHDDDNDLDTHVLIVNNNPESSNYGKTHELGYNKHILGKG